jgi:hypothetical protein
MLPEIPEIIVAGEAKLVRSLLGHLALQSHIVVPVICCADPRRNGKSCQAPLTTKPAPTATFRMSY